MEINESECPFFDEARQCSSKENTPMRRRLHEQLPLVPVPVAHAHARELEKISELLDELPSSALTRVQTDLLSRGDNFVDQWRGREGMTAEQVVRVLIIKQMNGYSYEELAF